MFRLSDRALTLVALALCAMIFVPLFTSFSYAQTSSQPSTGPVAYWSLNGNMVDSVGGHTSSASNAVTFETGKMGQGAKIGPGGYIDIPSSADLQNQKYTIEAWVRPDGPGPHDDESGSIIIHRGFSRPRGDFEASAQLSWRAYDGRFVYIFGNIPSGERIVSSRSFPVGSFYHLVATYDGAAFKLFVNGALEGEKALLKTLDYEPGMPWVIGSHSSVYRNDGWARTWNGIIDEVKIYNRALSPEELISPQLAYVANGLANSVSVIDLTSNTEVKRIAAVGDQPYSVALSPDESRAYVPNVRSGDVSVIDTVTQTVMKVIKVGSGPHMLAVSPDGTRIYVANTWSNSVSVIETVTNTVVLTIPVGLSPEGIIVSLDGKKTYVANNSSNNISVIDNPTNTVAAAIPVGNNPAQIALSPDGTRLYVPNRDSASMSVIDTKTDTVLASTYAGDRPEAVAVSPDGTRAYVTASLPGGGVTVFDTSKVLDPSKDARVTVIGIGSYPVGVACTETSVGTRIYVAVAGGGKVGVIDAATNNWVTSIPVDSNPAGIGLIQRRKSTPVTKVNQTINFSTILDKTYGDEPFPLSATATSGLPVSFEVLSGPANVSGNTLTITGAGAVTVKASQVGNANYQPAPDVIRSFNVAKSEQVINWAAPAPITYGTTLSVGQLNASLQTGDGLLSYSPATGTALTVGSHKLTVTASETAKYKSTTAYVTLQVNKAQATLSLGKLDLTYDGTAKPVSVTVDPAGLTEVQVTYNGSTIAPTEAGSYQVVASLTSSDYAASDAKGILVICKAPATISLSNLFQQFDNTPKSVTATTSPAGLTGLSITYNGSATAPAAAGYYNVVATLSNNNYQAPNANGILVINAPPSVNAGGPYSVIEGGSVQLAASATDPEAAALTYTWDLNNDGVFETTSQNATFSAAGLDGKAGQTAAVKVKVSDTQGGVTVVPVTISILNAPPVIMSIASTVDPVQVGTAVSVTGQFADAGVLDTHTATWSWDDGTVSAGTVTEMNGSGKVGDMHTYISAGVYEVVFTITDKDSGAAQSSYKYVVVYDPNAGFVTGGGWINSAAGAYRADIGLAGKANFGFVSKYQKGTNVPTGQTEFEFQVGNFKFSSTSYDWLVVAGAKAQYKGVGTVNGTGSYGFMLTATDGQVNGGGGVDKFRIKIWEKATGAVVYDNVLDADATDDLDNAKPQALGGGSIVIHSK